MLQSILSNLSIILLLHLCTSTLMNYRNQWSKTTIHCAIIVLFVLAVGIMFYLPIQYDGFRLDLRLIPLVFLAFFRGWKVTLPVLILTSIWRLLLGGDGALPGVVFGMVLPTLVALAFFKTYKQMNYLQKIAILSTCWFISDFPIIFIIPDGLTLFQQIFLLRYSSFLGAALILNALIFMEHKKEELNTKLEFLASHDQLTELSNKNDFMEFVKERLTKYPERKHLVAMIDIDFFKPINDTYGHLAGDSILQGLAQIFRKYESPNVKFSRYGGEEFIVYFEIDHLANALEQLEQLRKEINETVFSINEKDISISVSIGVASWEQQASLEVLINQADEQLYLAKNLGRNQIKYLET